jgi:hypothetical protein
MEIAIMTVKCNINSGQPIPWDMPDYKVGHLFLREVEQICPEAFSSVDVSTIMHRFPGKLKEERTRKIVFTRSSLSIGWECVRAFFMQLFCPKKAAERYRDIPKVANSQLVAALLGKDTRLNDDEMLKRAEDDLTIIFRRCQTLTIYLSETCNDIDADKLQENVYLTGARNTGENCLIS